MLTKNQKEKLFDLYPVLSRVDQDLLEQSLESATVIRLDKGTRIFDEMQPCNAFPFVLSGKIRVFKQSVNGRELSLYTVAGGDACIVTAGCLLGDEPYNASGQVKQDTHMVMMPSGAFNRLLGATVFREFIFSLISKRILELMQLVEEVAFQKLDRRLVSLLIRRGNRLKVSHQELAGELGTVREMVTRLLNSFSDTGLVRLGRGRIEILDEAGLRDILEN